MKKILSMLVLAITAFVAAPVMAADSPMTVAGATTVDTAKAKELFDAEALFVDVRKDADWDAGRVPGAEHLDIKSALTADSLAGAAAKDEAIVMYCNGHSCLRSSAASALAVSWGFTKVYYFRDGFPAWKAAGYPVE